MNWIGLLPGAAEGASVEGVGGVMLPCMLEGLAGRVVLWPSLCTAQCSFVGVEGRWSPLISCFREGSGMFLPNLDSKESRLLYVSSADMRAAPSPVTGGSSKE